MTLRRLVSSNVLITLQTILCSIITISATKASESLVHFEFSQDQCETGTFMNLGSLAQDDHLILQRDPNVTNCSIGALGIESSGTSEWFGSSPSLLSGSFQPVVERLSSFENSSFQHNPGVSMSFWIRDLEEESTLSVPIFTIGQASADRPNGFGVTECDRQNFDMQLVVKRGNVSEVLFRTNDQFFEPCQRLRFDTTTHRDPTGLMHIAIVLSEQRQQLFINGVSSVLLDDPFDGKLQHWSTSNTMHFFQFRNNPIWKGRLYQFELHPRAWTLGDVRDVMSRGTGHSLPHILPHYYRINEDAELTQGANPIEWYKDPNTPSHPEDSANFPTLQLHYSYLEEDVRSLLDNVGISYSGDTYEAFVYISELPQRGDIFRLDGENLTATSETLWNSLVLLEEPEVIFLPEHNSHSRLPGAVYTTMEVCVTVQQIFSQSQCVSSAPVEIIVDAVNDPPIARIAEAQRPYIVHEGIIEEETPLRLSGSDEDYMDRVTAVEITRPPELGFLYLSVSKRRRDGLMHGTQLSAINNIVEGQYADVEYRYTATDRILRKSSVTDSFWFRVRDGHGAWSSALRATVQVVPRLLDQSPEDPILVREDEAILLNLSGSDVSGLDRPIGFFVEDLPDGGIKYADPALGEEVDAEAVLGKVRPLMSQNKTSLEYTPAIGICNGEKNASTSIDYHILAYEEDGRIDSVSDLVSKEIEVECKLPHIGLTVPSDVIEVPMFMNYVDNPCNGYEFNSSTTNVTGCHSVVVFRNISVVSEAVHDQRATTYLSCDHGLLTLDQNKKSLWTLVKNQTVMRRSFGITAYPKDLNRIFEHLHYQSRHEGPDEIQIRIEYGNCQGANKTKSEAFYESECFVVSRSIAMDVLPPIPVPKAYIKFDFPWINFPFIIGLIMMMKFKEKLRAIKELKDEATLESMTAQDSTLIRWRQFYDEETGFYYYMNIEDREVTWQPPLDEEFIPAEEGGEDEAERGDEDKEEAS